MTKRAWPTLRASAILVSNDHPPVIQLSRMGLSHLTGSGHSLAALQRRDADRWDNPLPQLVRFPDPHRAATG